MVTFGELLGHVITPRGPLLSSRTGDDPPLPSLRMWISDTPPCAHSKRHRVYRHHFRVCFLVVLLLVNTGRSECTHGGVSEIHFRVFYVFFFFSACRTTHTEHQTHTHTKHTPRPPTTPHHRHHMHSHTQHNITHNITRRHRQRETEKEDRDRERREDEEKRRREGRRDEERQR